MKKWKCLVCGQIVEGENPPAACPLCKAPAEKFVEVKDEEVIYEYIPAWFNECKVENLVISCQREVDRILNSGKVESL